jgi:hypothetical protein
MTIAKKIALATGGNIHEMRRVHLAPSLNEHIIAAALTDPGFVTEVSASRRLSQI